MAMPFSGLVLGLLLLLSMASPASSCNEQEKASLLQFLAGLSQDNGLTVSWQNDTDCCEWEGITCCRDGAVVEVSLASRGLEGCISPSLGGLTNLQSLKLSHNSFTGGLPSELLASSSNAVLFQPSQRGPATTRELLFSIELQSTAGIEHLKQPVYRRVTICSMGENK